MSDMFDYLNWRGDILFSQLYVNPVDALIFSTLAYVDFAGVVPAESTERITLRQAAEAVLALPDRKSRARVPQDLELLKAAAGTQRFGDLGMCCYQSTFIPEQETQFAAVTYFLDDGAAFLAFRGTDNTLVGWKEDFNMTFQESVPSQRLALEYVRKFTAVHPVPLWLGGHSKGGNLAVYAAAMSDPLTQAKIVEVHNQDGPGFTEQMIRDLGYLRIVPKIRTFVPQSSVFGMLLEHEEPYTVIKSKQIGLLQHDPYSWEIMGGDFIRMEELAEGSQFLDRTFKNWLAGMTTEERNTFFDTLFELLMIEDTNHLRDILRPQNLVTYFKTIHANENMRQIISSELLNLIEAAKNAHQKALDQP